MEHGIFSFHSDGNNALLCYAGVYIITKMVALVVVSWNTSIEHEMSAFHGVLVHLEGFETMNTVFHDTTNWVLIFCYEYFRISKNDYCDVTLTL